jgi:hypothetical protein
MAGAVEHLGELLEHQRRHLDLDGREIPLDRGDGPIRIAAEQRADHDGDRCRIHDQRHGIGRDRRGDDGHGEAVAGKRARFRHPHDLDALKVDAHRGADLFSQTLHEQWQRTLRHGASGTDHLTGVAAVAQQSLHDQGTGSRRACRAAHDAHASTAIVMQPSSRR